MAENLGGVMFKTKHRTSGYVFSDSIVFLEQDYQRIPQHTGAVKPLVWDTTYTVVCLAPTSWLHTGWT